jgi:hypothetical protein
VFQFQLTGTSLQSQTILKTIPASDLTVSIPAKAYRSDFNTNFLTGGYVTFTPHHRDLVLLART